MQIQAVDHSVMSEVSLLTPLGGKEKFRCRSILFAFVLSLLLLLVTIFVVRSFPAPFQPMLTTTTSNTSLVVYPLSFQTHFNASSEMESVCQVLVNWVEEEFGNPSQEGECVILEIDPDNFTLLLHLSPRLDSLLQQHILNASNSPIAIPSQPFFFTDSLNTTYPLINATNIDSLYITSSGKFENENTLQVSSTIQSYYPDLVKYSFITAGILGQTDYENQTSSSGNSHQLLSTIPSTPNIDRILESVDTFHSGQGYFEECQTIIKEGQTQEHNTPGLDLKLIWDTGAGGKIEKKIIWKTSELLFGIVAPVGRTAIILTRIVGYVVGYLFNQPIDDVVDVAIHWVTNHMTEINEKARLQCKICSSSSPSHSPCSFCNPIDCMCIGCNSDCIGLGCPSHKYRWGFQCQLTCPSQCKNDCNQDGTCIVCSSSDKNLPDCRAVCPSKDPIMPWCPSQYCWDPTNNCQTHCPLHCATEWDKSSWSPSAYGCDQTGVCRACIDGLWGEHCDQICPIHCNANYCSTTTGYCAGVPFGSPVCAIGWWGPRCDQKCNCPPCYYDWGQMCSYYDGTCLTC